MPVFNAGKFLAPAIESLLGQTAGDFELLVIDDASSDQSRDVVEKFCKIDNRIRPFFQRENRGISATRNFALEQARGKYIGFLNHDDVALPERFARQLDFLARNEDVDLVGSAVENIDADGKSLNLSPMPENDLEIRWMNLLDCPIRQSALMTRRALFGRGLRYDPRVVSYSDYDFVSRAIRTTRAANLPEPLTQYRKHPRNTSRVRWEMFVESGARIALEAIETELPEFKIDIEQVAAMRAVIFGYKPASAVNSLGRIKRAVSIYLDMFEAFSAKYRGHPLLTHLPRPNVSKFLAREDSAPNE